MDDIEIEETKFNKKQNNLDDHLLYVFTLYGSEDNIDELSDTLNTSVYVVGWIAYTVGKRVSEELNEIIKDKFLTGDGFFG